MLVVVALAVLSLISYQAVRSAMADYGVRSGDMRWTERATAIEPGNGESWDRLGRLKQWDFDNPDPSEAIAAYKRAVNDDPNSAHYWMDLSSAYEAAGNTSEARAALDHAKQVYPLSAEVAWNYGNFLLREEQFADGYAEIRRAVRSDPSLLSLAISRTWHSNKDANQLLDQVLPAEVPAYFQAIDYFGSVHEPAAALEVWQRLLRLQKPFGLGQAFPFIESLVHEDRAEDAKKTWEEALTATGTTHDQPRDGSVIWNGDFAHDFLQGGLDWRWNPPLGVATEFDPAPASHGARSLRLDFAGSTNLELVQPDQSAPVEPNRTYRFQAYMRTESLTTESGVRFILFDPNHDHAPRAITTNMTGTQPWTVQKTDITTGPETHFLSVRLYRVQSRMFDNRLSGAAWIADVSLKPLDADGKAANAESEANPRSGRNAGREASR